MKAKFNEYNMKLYIKYMVSLRCKMLVKSELEKLGLTCISVDLGIIDIKEEISKEQLELFNKNLKKWGLELLNDRKHILVEKIKSVIIEMIYYEDEAPKVNAYDYISEKLGYDYIYLSNTFSEVKGMTIQQYIIQQKIEKVKDLLMYDELTLTEIAYKLHYSSVAHLSNQFKKVTGLTPTYFKELKEMRDIDLEDLKKYKFSMRLGPNLRLHKPF